MKKKIGIIGYFATGMSKAGGQEAKTCFISDALKEIYGSEQVVEIDTLNWKKKPLRLLWRLFRVACCSENIIMLPAQNGVKVFSTILLIINVLCHAKLHYVVIGGWLPEYIKNDTFLSDKLKRFDGIYVETESMKNALDKSGFCNTFLFPNCKDIRILKVDELSEQLESHNYRVCTFSRIMKEKGIEDAIEVVKYFNLRNGKDAMKLDIYGQVAPSQVEWFNELQKTFPNFVEYKGVVPFNMTVETIKEYHALLFPTFYAGEGFPGTLIDAMASGVPVIASDWKYNRDIIKPHIGLIFETHNIEDFCNKLEYLLFNPERWQSCKVNSVNEAFKYLPENVIAVLIKNLR